MLFVNPVHFNCTREWQVCKTAAGPEDPPLSAIALGIDFVDNTVGYRLFSIHEEVAVGILLNLL